VLTARLLVAAYLAGAAVACAQTSAQATFAMGCFWCAEEAFEKVPGVLSVVSGYTGGHKRNPTYEEVVAGTTGHTEAVRVTYDPARVSYEELLDVFWLNHDPTAIDRQFCDHGSQYRPAIFFHNPEQRRAAQASRSKYERIKPFKQPIRTPIEKVGEFWPAEEYHQDYYRKNPARYRFYVAGCGRYERLDELWGRLRRKP